jgi:hypothetical protein
MEGTPFWAFIAFLFTSFVKILEGGFTSIKKNLIAFFMKKKWVREAPPRHRTLMPMYRGAVFRSLKK